MLRTYVYYDRISSPRLLQETAEVEKYLHTIFNRPGVAGAVLQTPP